LVEEPNARCAGRSTSPADSALLLNVNRDLPQHLRDLLVITRYLLGCRRGIVPAVDFSWFGNLMNYQAFTNDSLTMMHHGVRGALAADDALNELGKECRFRVRDTPEWKVHAADLEAEMLRRGMAFEVIDWTEVQPSLPFAFDG
jgi:hypothetical protein